MARIRANNVFGTVTNNPLAAGGTSLTSAGLANLPAVTGSDVAVITLDPNRVHGAPEIVYVTAHTGGAGTATILRGQEGTAARQHPADTFWVHGSPASEIERVYDPPACRVFNNTGPSITTGGTEKVLTFTAERYDTDGMWTPAAPSRITFNTRGLYAVTAQMIYSPNTAGDRIVSVRLNGTTWIVYETQRARTGAAGPHILECSTQYLFSAGDYVEMMVFQDSGATLTATAFQQTAPEMMAAYLGSGD